MKNEIHCLEQQQIIPSITQYDQIDPIRKEQKSKSNYQPLIKLTETNSDSYDTPQPTLSFPSDSTGYTRERTLEQYNIKHLEVEQVIMGNFLHVQILYTDFLSSTAIFYCKT